MARRNKGTSLKWLESRQLWYIIWYEGGHIRKKSTGTGDRSKAEQKLSRHIIEKDQPVDVVSPTRRYIADVLAAYAEEHIIHTRSQEATGHNIKALIPFWGHRVVSDVRPVLCREYALYRRDKAKKAGKNASDGLLARELGVLSSAIRHDYKQGRLAAYVHVWKPAPSAPKDRWLTRDEVARLLRTARAKHRISHQTGEKRIYSFARWHLSFFILMALYTAARKEALTTLTWSQIDLERGIVNLNKANDKITNKRRAIVPIPSKLMTFLRIAKKRAPEDCSDEYVINYFGKPVLRLDQSFRRVARDAGFTDVTPHTLRHTAATWMAQAGVPLWVIAKYLGHSSTKTTERVYAHHNPSFLMEAKRALEEHSKRAIKNIISKQARPHP